MDEIVAEAVVAAVVDEALIAQIGRVHDKWRGLLDRMTREQAIEFAEAMRTLALDPRYLAAAKFLYDGPLSMPLIVDEGGE